jgi:hypothetical protein
MGSLQDALAKAGLATAAAQQHQQQPQQPRQQPSNPKKAVDPCIDSIGERCHCLVMALGAPTAIRILEEVATTSYGKDRRQDVINGTMSKTLDRMPSGQAREIRSNSYCTWAFSKAQVLNDTIDACIDALMTGAYDTWLAAQEAAKNAPKWPQFCFVKPEDDSDLGFHLHRQLGEYQDALDAWADQRTELELRKLNFNSYDIRTKAREEGNRAVESHYKQMAQEAASRIRTSYEGGGSTWKDCLAALEALPYGCVQYLPGCSHSTVLSGTCRAWQEGRGSGAMPAGCQISDDALRTVARHERAARDELRRRYPGVAICCPGNYSTATYLVCPLESDCRDVFDIPADTLTVSLTPSAGGWFSSEIGKWVSPEVATAISRLASSGQGSLQIHPEAMRHYGRHPEKGFPRFRAAAWKTPVQVGVDDRIARQLDDVKLVYDVDPRLVPSCAYWLEAVGRRTANGGLHLYTSTSAPESRLVVVYGSTSSHGRHGVSGTTHMPTKDNQAPAAAAFGGSGGGGQHRTVVFAVITQDAPLLLDSGVGITLDETGLRWVPGLGCGKPAPGKPWDGKSE